MSKDASYQIAKELEKDLRQRTVRLAERQLEQTSRVPAHEVIVVRIGQTLVGAPVLATNEARQVQVVRCPGATEVVVGVFQIRGRTFGLVNLDPVFHATAQEHVDKTNLVLVLSGRPGELGILIDEVLGFREVFADEIDESAPRGDIQFVSDVTRDLVHILDVESLLASPVVRLRD
jgi:chemotaxis signal transduction protein